MRREAQRRRWAEDAGAFFVAKRRAAGQRYGPMSHTKAEAGRWSVGADRVVALPIVFRELRIAASRASTYWTRVAVALITVLIGGYASLIAFFGMGSANGGGVLFSVCTSLAFYYCIVVGLRNCADCISAEKREGTLGLLLLTDLRGYDVVFGKLFAVGLKSFYGFLAGFPVLAISLMLGGVTGLQFWQTTLALMNIFFLAHAIGLTVSVFSMEGRQAYRNAVVLTLSIFIGIPFIDALLSKYGYLNAAQFLALLSPSYPYSHAGFTGSRYSFYWTSLLLTHAMGWGLLAFASWRLPYVWQERAGTTRRRWSDFWQKWRYGSTAVRTRFRRRLLGVNPFFWLTSRAYRQPMQVWAVFASFAALWILVWEICKTSYPGNASAWEPPMFLVTITMLHFMIKAGMASEATRHLAEHRQNGSLELLLSCTPLEVPEIIAGHWMTLRRQFLWPLVAILGVDIALAIVSPKEVAAYICCAAGLLVADAFAIGWVGMWLGLSAKPKHASGGTLFRVLVLPGLVWSLMVVLIPRYRDVFLFNLVLWCLIGASVDFVFFAYAKDKLLKNFRVLASPQGEARGILAALGRSAGTQVANWKAAHGKVDPSF